MKKAGLIIHVLVFCVWIALLSSLLYRNYTGTILERTQILKEYFGEQSYWYDIYQGTKKIGFAFTAFEKAGDEIIITHKREMKVFKNDKETIRFEELKSLTDSFYSINFFEYASYFRGRKGFNVRGEVDADMITLYRESPEMRKTDRIAKQVKDFYLPITLIPVIHQKIPTSKKPFIVPMLDLFTSSINDVRVVLEEIRPVKIGADILNIYKFRVGKSFIWSNEKGIILKEMPPSGITLYSQFKKIAKVPDDRVIFDYTSLPFFKSDTIIPYPEELNRLMIRIKGFRLNPQLYKDSIVTLKKDTLTIVKEDIGRMEKNTYTLPSVDDAFSEYLGKDEWVMTDYKPLQNTGRIYARSVNHDAFRFARYLNNYLYNILKTMPLFFLSNSENILKSLSGDYLERTVMFATYARAGGLPTRLVGGLVYVDGYFYFHTWPEVWFGKWVPIDPTLLQFPADVTHIPLKEGPLHEIVSVADYLRKIDIEILEAI
jgi:hypothetical protein